MMIISAFSIFSIFLSSAAADIDPEFSEPSAEFSSVLGEYDHKWYEELGFVKTGDQLDQIGKCKHSGLLVCISFPYHIFVPDHVVSKKKIFVNGKEFLVSVYPMVEKKQEKPIANRVCDLGLFWLSVSDTKEKDWSEQRFLMDRDLGVLYIILYRTYNGVRMPRHIYLLKKGVLLPLKSFCG